MLTPMGRRVLINALEMLGASPSTIVSESTAEPAGGTVAGLISRYDCLCGHKG